MNREEIKERLIELCGEIFRDEGIDFGLIKYVDFYNDLGMDSISFISMIVEIEACFDITIPDDMLLMENFRNVTDVVHIVFDLLAKKH